MGTQRLELPDTLTRQATMRSKEAAREYYRKNREDLNARRRAKYWADPEEAHRKTNAWRAANRQRHYGKQRAWIKANWKHVQRYNADFKARLLGASLDWYELKYREQDGRCAICGEPHQRLCIDHDHTTKRARALLCHRCNRGLGYFRENVAFLRGAAAYILQHQEVSV